jgi:signal transduction histidine kinase/tetratricopeptide (TPR) repeat protein
MNLSRKLVFLILVLIGLYQPIAANTLDSLLLRVSYLGLPNQASELSKNYYHIGQEFYYGDSFEEAKKYYSLALEIIEIEKDYESYFSILLGLGKANKRLNNYEKAVENFLEIIGSKHVLPNNHTLANTYNHLGSIYQSLGEYEKAYQEQLNALHFHELERDSSGIGRDYYEIGSILYYQKRFDQALEYYGKAYDYFNQIKHQKLIYSSLAAMGSSHHKLGNLAESLDYGTRALDLARTLKYKTGIAYALGNMAQVKLQQNKTAEAKKMLKEALKLKEDLNDPWAIIGGNLGIVRANLVCQTPRKAIPYLDTALDLSLKIKSKTRELETYQEYEKVYRALNDFPKSYSYLKKYTMLKDSVLNEKTVQEMGQTKRRFEMEKKESEIALLTTKNENLEYKKKIQRLQAGIFLSLLLIVLIAFGVNARSLKMQRETNLVLEKQQKKIQTQNKALKVSQTQLRELNILLEQNNKLLEERNEEVKTKNDQLENSNEDLKNFAYVASHDLKEPLRMIHSYTSLLKRRYNHLLDESGKEFIFYVTDAVERMDIMLNDLLDYSRIDSRGEANVGVDLKDVMLIVNSNLTNLLEEKNATLIYDQAKFPVVKSSFSRMTQLFQNLISNGVKFKGEEDPVVMVTCKKEAGKIIFSIKDNGIGIALADQKKVFEMFKRLHTRGKYEGTGIGLATCKKIVQKDGGSIWIESVEGEGTTFFFSMPAFVEELVEA